MPSRLKNFFLDCPRGDTLGLGHVGYRERAVRKVLFYVHLDGCHATVGRFSRSYLADILSKHRQKIVEMRDHHTGMFLALILLP